MISDRPIAVMGFTVARGKIVQIDCLLDPERLARLDLALHAMMRPETLIASAAVAVS